MAERSSDENRSSGCCENCWVGSEERERDKGRRNDK